MVRCGMRRKVFRDQFLKHLESVSPGDLDGYAAKLDSLGNVLDYRKCVNALHSG